MNILQKEDPEIYKLIQAEKKRQEETLMMIPSENIASQAVLEALSSVLTNKYSEGYPHKRYYQGQEFIDKIEDLCIKRAKQLFHVPHVNVQPYSGSPANAAVYFAILKPGDKIMGLSLSSGGHLTHGVPQITFSGRFFQSVQYQVNSEGVIDYNKLEEQVLKEKPKLIIVGTTHYPRILNFPRFAQIAKTVDAFLLADVSHVVGLIIAGVYPDPVPYVHVVTTTTHKTLRGPRGAMIMVTEKGLTKDREMGKKIDKAVFPGLQGGPHNHQTAALAVSLKEASKPGFKKYGKQVVKNAIHLAETLKGLGYDLMSGGTDSHVLLVDLRKQKILGNTIAEALEEVNIILNRNTVPFDQNPPYFPSGIRMGTPGITSRGMKEKEMEQIGKWIDITIKEVLKAKEKLNIISEQEKKKEFRQQMIAKCDKLKDIQKEVKRLCRKFPICENY